MCMVKQYALVANYVFYGQINPCSRQMYVAWPHARLLNTAALLFFLLSLDYTVPSLHHAPWLA